MIHAVLKNKCGELRMSEDAFTSIVFGYLKYRPFRTELIEFLGQAINLSTHARKYSVPDWLQTVDSDAFRFWERMDSDKEPDLRIEKSKDESLIVEVKLDSKEQKGQLGKYLSCVSENAPLIYITLHRGVSDVLSSSFNRDSKYGHSEKSRIYWLSWHDLHKVLKTSLDKMEKSNPDGYGRTKREMTIDLLMFLEKRGINFFDGFTGKDETQALAAPVFWAPTFFAWILPNVQKFTKPIFWEETEDDQ